MIIRYDRLVILSFILMLYKCSAEFFTVLEEQPPGTWVGNITRRANLRYYFSGIVDHFRIDEVYGSIYTKSKIDRESLKRDEFDLVVLSSAPIYPTEVTIKVIDINDHTPKFQSSFTNISISESLTAGTLIPIGTASDPDTGSNTIANYTITNQSKIDEFSLEIVLNILHLKLIKQLDREVKDTYMLNISAFDNGTPRKYGYMTLNLHVEDANDNAPSFDPSSLKADIYENATIGTVVHIAHATDQDIGDNGLIKYSIEVSKIQSDSEIFHINPSTGSITLNGKLDYESKKQYTIHVIASDSGSPVLNGRAKLTVNVLNVNDNPPTITNSRGNPITVLENRMTNAIAFFTVEDRDKDIVTMQLVSGNEDGKFRFTKLNQQYYYISLTSSLDREIKDQYSLEFRATDNGTPQLMASYVLVVNVGDVNDNKPVFKQSNYFASVYEGCALGSYIGDVSATDRDSGANSKLNYYITSGNDRDWFRLSSYSGLLTTNSDAIDFDVLPKPFIVLEISANDSGSPALSSVVTFNVSIEDINDNTPVFSKPSYHLLVNESAKVGSVLFQFQAKDKDHGKNGQIIYKFSKKSQYILSTFHVRNITGELVLQRKLDHLTDISPKFYIIATDNGTPPKFTKAKVMISVLDVDNFSPVFSPTDYYMNVLHSESQGFLLRLTTIDFDTGRAGKVTYEIVNGDCCNNFFINRTTGELFSQKKFPTGSSYKLTVKAKNIQNTNTTNASVFIYSLGNFAFNPSFSRDEYSFNVYENTVDKFVGEVKVLSSHDTGLMYTIISGDKWNFFRIDQNGRIFTKKAIDRERFEKFVLTVSARTNESLPLTSNAKIIIKIDDLNDNSPELLETEKSYYRVQEDALYGTCILTVKAKDADLGQNSALKYSIIKPSEEGVFQIDIKSGNVYLVKNLLTVNKALFNLDIEISDNGIPSRSLKTTIKIAVIDINNHYPTFKALSYNRRILRNMSVNTQFLQVISTDGDFGNNGKVLYRITSGNVADTFGIFPNGWLFLKQPSLPKDISYYLLQVQAYDGGMPPKLSTVTVNVFIDENKAGRIFRKSALEVAFRENLPSDSLVTSLSENMYFFNSSVKLNLSIPSSYFTLRTDNGVLRSKSVLDREKIVTEIGTDTIILLVMAQMTDGVSSVNETCIISVKVIDVNDNGPIFKKSNYVVNIAEDANQGTEVLRLSATDADSEQNNGVIYELGSTATVPFVLNSSSGVLSVVPKSSSLFLDRESISSYNLTVIARDVKNTSMQTSCRVLILLTDVNDNEPRFTGNNNITVSEEMKVGSTFATISAVDRDIGMNSILKYSIAGSPKDSSFNLNPYTGELYLVKELDYETQVSHTLSILAQDLGTPSLQTRITYLISVIDANDNHPTFQADPIVIHVRENVPLGSVIGHCQASDADSGQNKQIKYSVIQQGPEGNAFAIDSLSCSISTLKEIDRERNDAYYLIVKAEDQAADPLKRLASTKNISIIVLDQNDNSPFFVPPIAAGFNRRSSTDWQIMTVQAVDQDKGLNGTVKYSIIPGLEANCFRINENTGIVTVVAPLSNSKKIFEIDVKAIDQGPDKRSSISRITFFVLGSSINAPSCIGPSQVTINEDVYIGKNVTRIQASSRVSSSRIRYFIKARISDDKLAIDSDTGWISTQKILDYETDPMYSIVVYAVEFSGPTPATAECHVTVKISDVNDNRPSFNSSFYTVNVMENAGINSEVVKLQATDKDSDSNGIVAYSIIAGNSRSLFRIDSNTGIIYLNRNLDRENASQHNLTIAATDNDQIPLQSTTRLVIHVLDVNDNKPHFNQSFYSFDITENAPKDTYIGQVLAVDRDINRNGEISYEISDGDSNIFEVDPTSGKLRLSGTVDHEQMPNFILQITASDYGKPKLSGTVLVFINVMDINDNCPVFSKQKYKGNVSENKAPGTLLLNLTAADKDSGIFRNVRYNIFNGNENWSFSITKDGGIVTTRTLDREQTSAFSLRISAKDRSDQSKTKCFSFATVSITVDDENDNSPFFDKSLIVHVSEETSAGSLIHTLSAKDFDYGLNSALVYKMVKPNSLEDMFQVEPNGKLYLRSRVDYETIKEYSFNISVSDQGVPARKQVAVLKIVVDDYNDNSPVIGRHQPNVSIPENITIGSTIMTFSAFDLDSNQNSRISFSLLSGNKNNAFSIDSEAGVLFNQKELDFEKQSTYVLEVEARDHGKPQRRGVTSLNIVLKDVNDFIPVFNANATNVSIAENAGPSILVRLVARDLDSGLNGRIRYSLVASEYSDMFSVDPLQGIVSTIQPLDRERFRSTNLTIVGQDQGTPSLKGFTSLIVNVLDENDNSPKILPSNSTIHVKENLLANLEIQQLVVTDPDYGLNSSWECSLQNNFGRFQQKVSGSSLVISTTTNLDRELTASYQLLVTCNDKGMPRMSSNAIINIIVDDDNDSPPVFVKSSFTAQIQGGGTAESFVTQLKVTDRDTTSNSRVQFSIVSGNTSYFSIEQQSGVVVTKSSVPVSSVFEIKVQASDPTKASFRQTATLTITTSTGFPTFNHGKQFTSISESLAVNSSFLTINASSDEIGPAGKINYFIHSGNIGEVFKIDQSTGKLAVSSSLDYETRSIYSLWIEARDSRNPPLSSFLKVVITIINEDDSAPLWTIRNSVVSFKENQDRSALVVIVNATDIDNPSRNPSRIRYKFDASSMSLPFSINSYNGEIRSTAVLDREKTDRYNINVIAYPNDQPLRTSMTSLNVVIEDVNDNAPVIHSPKAISISEDLPVGSEVLKVNATDDDIGSNSKITFLVVSDTFKIDLNNGKITLVKSLDHETKSSYLLAISARDPSFETIYQLTVLIIDINDSPPHFPPNGLSFNVSESISIGQSFGQVKADDKDSGLNSISFYYFKPRNGYGIFAIDSRTGFLTVKRKVKFYKPNSTTKIGLNQYKFTVFARNLYRPFYLSNATLLLNITDYNDHRPLFSKKLYEAAVLSTASLGQVVTRVHAADAFDYGLNALVRYTIKGGNGSNLFSVKDGNVKVKASLLSFSNKVLTLLISAEDLGSPTQIAEEMATVNIAITAENIYTPRFLAISYQKTVHENYRTYQEIIKVETADRDAGVNGIVSYRIKSGDADSRFSIGVNNGSVFAVRSLDYESVQSYDLVIEARDGSKLQSKNSTVHVRISLSDVNDNSPLFTSSNYQAKIAENEPIDTPVLRIAAVDRDRSTGNVITYAIVDSISRSFFKIDGVNGQITTNAVIDYERNSFFDIQISAIDNGNPAMSSLTHVHVTVTGKNEFSPKFKQSFYNFSISKNSPIGYLVGKVEATDNDAGIDGVQAYLPRTSFIVSPFSIESNTGKIRVKKKLLVGDYNLKIYVKNILVSALTPDKIDQTDINIKVEEDNDPPVFQQQLYAAEVKENATIGQSVLTVKAIDKDSKVGETISYSVINQQPKSGFSVDISSGIIRVASKLDWESVQEYNLTILATDKGARPASNTTQVKIKVLDVNDMAPVITACNGSVYENASVNTIVAKALVTDGDSRSNRGPFRFRIANSDKFDIKSNTGELIIKSSLDRESLAVHNVSILVTDNGSPPLTATGFCIVKVLDISDVPPKQRNVKIIVNGLTDFPQGGFLGDVSPLDADLSDIYSCKHNTVSSVFSFEASSCKLHAASHRDTGIVRILYSAVTHDANVYNNSATIQFVNLKNATAKKMLVFRLHGTMVSLETFTNSTLPLLSKHFISISPKGFSIRIIGYHKPTISTLDMLLAMQDSTGLAVSSLDLLKQLVASSEQRIKSLTEAASLTSPQNACLSENPCLNNGICTDMLKLENHPTIWSTEMIIFHSISFKSTFKCQCKAGYHGIRCDHAVSSCSQKPCLNGGVCIDGNSAKRCQCVSGFTGMYCETDLNECQSSPCKNSGVCVNTIGSYSCRCTSKYTGKQCETEIDQCNPNPCLNDGRCITDGNSFTCSCTFGSIGRFCEINPQTFSELSYLTFPYTSTQNLNISLDYATRDKNSLLVYGFHKTQKGTLSQFIGLELVNGHLKFSFSSGTGLRSASVDAVTASDGKWHSARILLSGQKMTLTSDNSQKHLALNEGNSPPNLGGAPVYFGGVDSIKSILDRPKQVSTDDFVGCMRNIFINGRVVNSATASESHGVTAGCKKATDCTGSPCKNGKCMNNWTGFQCQCNTGFSGSTCSAASKPFTYGGSSFVTFKLKESYRRKLQLSALNTIPRKRRDIVNKLPQSNVLSIQFRTRINHGTLMLAEDVGGNFTALHINNGQVHYKFDLQAKGSGSMSITNPLVNDGKWHNITLKVNDRSVSLNLDTYYSNENSFSVPAHKFFSVSTNFLSFAGSANPRSVDSKQLKNFQGCLHSISLNGDNLSIMSSDKFNVTQVGSVANHCTGSDVCASNPCLDPIRSYCVDVWEAYKCVAPGKCADKPCLNSGVCVPKDTSYTCNCRGNFTGRNCETPLVCLTSPCKANEKCVADDKNVFSCILTVTAKSKGLETKYIVLITVLTICVVGLVVVAFVVLKRRKPNRPKNFKGDFTDAKTGIELEERNEKSSDNVGFELEENIDINRSPFGQPLSAYEFENEAYEKERNDIDLRLLSKRNAKYLSRSQPMVERPQRQREASHNKRSNRSLQLTMFINQQIGAHSDSRLHDENRLNRQRNERILQDLRGSQDDLSDCSGGRRDQPTGKDAFLSSERVKSLNQEYSINPKIQIGSATPPFESGFESTGSDVYSDREQASVTDIALENASSQLELYDLEVASIGFSEMSWQNDNNSSSLRDYRRENMDRNIDRFRHFPPHLGMYDHGSSISDRNTRSDFGDRLSDVIEQDSSSDSDGSFTCSEYEYGDERISTNKLNRKRLVFSKHTKHQAASESDMESSFRPRRNSNCSSMTSLTDVGSILPSQAVAIQSTPAIPQIDWDALLNWGMKYENLADVYRALAAFDTTSKSRSQSSLDSDIRSSPVRSQRLKVGSKGDSTVNRPRSADRDNSKDRERPNSRDRSIHSSQELSGRKPVIYVSQDSNTEEYV